MEFLLQDNTVGMQTEMLARYIGIEAKEDTGNEEEDFLKKRSAKLNNIMVKVNQVDQEINEYEQLIAN